MSNAIDGTNMGGLRSFEVAVATTTTAEQAIAQGSYEFVSDTDCYVKFGETGMAAAIALTSSQPLVTAASGRILRLHALKGVPVDISNTTTFIRVIRKSADGTLTINGPFLRSANP